MLEYLIFFTIIIVAIIFTAWRKAYLTQTLLLTNFFIFIYVFAMLYVPNQSANEMGDNLFNNLTFVPARFGQIEYVPTIFTSMFMHIDPAHLIGNMLILYLIGLPLEERIGTKKFAVIYSASGLLATLVFYVAHMTSISHLLGASGAIFGIAGALLILYPRDEIPMFLGIFFTARAPVWLAVGITIGVETVLTAISINDGVAHIAHLGGALCGLAIAPLIVKKELKKPKETFNFDNMRLLARTKEDVEMVNKIEAETEPDVRNAWLQFFFKEVARCPKCKRRVNYADEIKCECGQTVKLKK